MNKCALLPALMLLLSSAAIHAADDATQGPAPQTAATSQADSAAASQKQLGSHCLRESGSLIQPGKSGCLDGEHGSSYSRDDLDRQSGTKPADLLKYDPSVSVGHH